MTPKEAMDKRRKAMRLFHEVAQAVRAWCTEAGLASDLLTVILTAHDTHGVWIGCPGTGRAIMLDWTAEAAHARIVSHAGLTTYHSAHAPTPVEALRALRPKMPRVFQKEDV